ncbi:hypothetical protein [Burkholderia contaminans]|uniref:hypothetical protein n=1 Tax=Burkholderia contaminans TaxID=488447 RepID=UPI001589E892|nr:hypothetical protein [Burkholderia contaminans]
MKRLGVNQKLNELFNRVLNKPEHENKPHQFGDFIFSFNRVTMFNLEQKSEGTKVTQVEGFYFTLLQNWKNTRWSQIVSSSNQAQPSLTEMMKKFSGYEEDKIKFRYQFTKYLNCLDMNEKLRDIPGRKSAKNKI